MQFTREVTRRIRPDNNPWGFGVEEEILESQESLTYSLDSLVINGNSFYEAECRLILPWLRKEGQYVNDMMLPLRGLQMINIAEHQPKYPVMSMGPTDVKGMKYGHKTVAGSLGFVVINQDPFYGAVRLYKQKFTDETNNVGFTSPLQLPPMNLLVSFFNSDEFTNTIYIKGLTLVDSGTETNANNHQLVKSVSFIAHSTTMLTPVRVV